MSLPKASHSGNDLNDENSNESTIENATENINRNAAKNTKSKGLIPNHGLLNMRSVSRGQSKIVG